LAKSQKIKKDIYHPVLVVSTNNSETRQYTCGTTSYGTANKLAKDGANITITYLAGCAKYLLSWFN
jgi:hypothetical protein